MEKYYKRKYVADMLSVSISTLVKFIHKHKLKEIYITGDIDSWWNKSVRIPQSTIDQIEKYY